MSCSVIVDPPERRSPARAASRVAPQCARPKCEDIDAADENRNRLSSAAIVACRKVTGNLLQ